MWNILERCSMNCQNKCVTLVFMNTMEISIKFVWSVISVVNKWINTHYFSCLSSVWSLPHSNGSVLYNRESIHCSRRKTAVSPPLQGVNSKTLCVPRTPPAFCDPTTVDKKMTCMLASSVVNSDILWPRTSQTLPKTSPRETVLEINPGEKRKIQRASDWRISGKVRPQGASRPIRRKEQGRHTMRIWQAEVTAFLLYHASVL